MTTREVEVPKIPESMKEIVDKCLKGKTWNLFGDMRNFGDAIIDKLGINSPEYKKIL